MLLNEPKTFFPISRFYIPTVGYYSMGCENNPSLSSLRPVLNNLVDSRNTFKLSRPTVPTLNITPWWVFPDLLLYIVLQKGYWKCKGRLKRIKHNEVLEFSCTPVLNSKNSWLYPPIYLLVLYKAKWYTLPKTPLS